MYLVGFWAYRRSYLLWSPVIVTFFLVVLALKGSSSAVVLYVIIVHSGCSTQRYFQRYCFDGLGRSEYHDCRPHPIVPTIIVRIRVVCLQSGTAAFALQGSSSVEYTTIVTPDGAFNGTLGAATAAQAHAVAFLDGASTTAVDPTRSSPLLIIRVVCPQNGTAISALKGSIFRS